MTRLITRRSVIAAGAAAGTLTTLPISMVRLAFGGTREDFSFTYISDSHIQQIKGASFVRNWDMGLKRAVAEANLIYAGSRFRDVRRRSRAARQEGGARPRRRDAFACEGQAPLRHGRA